MLKLGFANQWVHWIMFCVTSVSYAAMLNQYAVGPIFSSGGLRQDDPLHPYLFISCAKGLTSLIKQAEIMGDIHGIRICRRAPSISHLLFADMIAFYFIEPPLEKLWF